MKKLGFKPFSDLNPSNFFQEKNGDGGIRTLDPHVANVVLSQLSYTPN